MFHVSVATFFHCKKLLAFFVLCANLGFVENTSFSPKTGFCDLCQKISLCFLYCNSVSRSVSLDYGDITKYNISISFDWQWLFWSAEGLNARPVHSKLDRFPRFQTKETPEKGAVNEQSASCKVLKWILQQLVAGNHMLIVANTQRIVECEHVEIVRFSSFAQSGKFALKNCYLDNIGWCRAQKWENKTKWGFSLS